jgi:preprotein translocase subunit SecY
MSDHGFMTRLRNTASRWQSLLSAAGIAAVCEVGARVGIPGVAGEAVEQFVNAGHAGLIWVYNIVAGGGTSRAALLAVGVVPYLTARLYVWIGRSLSPSIRRHTHDEKSRSRVVRRLTVGLSVIQAFGYASFVSRIPGAVAHPGIGFLSRTVLLLTGSAIVAGLLADQMLKGFAGTPDADSRPAVTNRESTTPASVV